MSLQEPLYTTPQVFTQKQKDKHFFNRQRHDFLLTFFELPHHYEVKEVNGFILVRQFNGTSNGWEVAIYTKDSWNSIGRGVNPE
jgi:hypothetical protein